MKKVFAFVCVIAILFSVSSCKKKTCPAYSYNTSLQQDFKA